MSPGRRSERGQRGRQGWGYRQGQHAGGRGSCWRDLKLEPMRPEPTRGGRWFTVPGRLGVRGCDKAGTGAQGRNGRTLRGSAMRVPPSASPTTSQFPVRFSPTSSTISLLFFFKIIALFKNNSLHHKIHPFKVHNSVISYTFMKLYNHHHY